MKRIVMIGIVGSLWVSCAAPSQRVGIGTGIGAGVGAGVGAIIGHQSGKKKEGALIGGVLGGLVGAGIGKKLDRQAEALAAVAEVKRTEDAVIATLKNSILFDVDSASLKPTALDPLQKIGDIIKLHPEDRVIVVGHTDDKGSDIYNQQLSERRAQAVRLQMISRGVPASRVEAVGQGESQPIASNETNDGRAQNRRVEIIISADPTEPG